MKESTVKFTGYSIKKFNLEKDNDINKDNMSDQNEMELNFECLQNNENKNFYCVNMKVETTTENKKVEVVMEGYFEFSKDTEDELIDYFLKVTAPTVLYPYCRTFVSSVTSFDSNQAILLPIINFSDIDKNN